MPPPKTDVWKWGLDVCTGALYSSNIKADENANYEKGVSPDEQEYEVYVDGGERVGGDTSGNALSPVRPPDGE